MMETGVGTLGRYTLVREIARSNDIVWEGVDPQMNRRVAVKELALPPNLAGQAKRERIERFYREARAAGAMSHPNIVTIHEVGEDHGRYFIAMEFLEGQTLRDRLSTVGALPVNEAIAVTSALCDALEYAHQHGVIHRDIKPENVHLLPGGRVKLTDFGIARITNEAQLTVAGQVFGTPSYMSPEQVIGKEIDRRSDIFALGVLLYEMLTGRKPFTGEGDSVVTITYKIMNEPMPVAIGASQAIDAVIRRATEKDPAARFASADEFQATLQAAAESRSAPATPALRTTATSIPASQATQAYGMKTEYAVAPGPIPTGPAVMPSPLPISPQYAPPTTRPGRSTALTVASVLVVLFLLSAGGWAVMRAYRIFTQEARGSGAATEYAQGAGLYKQGKYEEAAAIFRKTRLSPTADPGIVRQATDGELYCYRQLGHEAQERDDLMGAQRWFQEAVKLAPDDAQARSELEAVQKALLANSSTSNSTPASPAPAASAPPSTLPAASPAPTSPQSNVTTSDFEAANAQGAAQADTLVQQGIGAYQNGDLRAAQNDWYEAVKVGPGSPAAQKATEYVTRLGQGKNPFAGD
jgi:serine/threonine-protein kinase